MNLWELTQVEFQGAADGSAHTIALYALPQPAPNSEAEAVLVAQLAVLEETKWAVREYLQEDYPATKSYHYETSWQGRDYSAAHRQMVIIAVARGEPVPPRVLRDYLGECWADKAWKAGFCKHIAAQCKGKSMMPPAWAQRMQAGNTPGLRVAPIAPERVAELEAMSRKG